MSNVKKRSNCPISLSLEVWGDKWSLLIIRDLMFEQKRTYGDFLKSHELIATNILASRLKSLKEHGIIETAPPGRGYRLTPKGMDLLPVMLEIYLWAEKHYPIPEHVQDILRLVKADKSGFTKATMQALRAESEQAS